MEKSTERQELQGGNPLGRERKNNMEKLNGS